jgi:ABC-type transporter Mla MlaB component
MQVKYKIVDNKIEYCYNTPITYEFIQICKDNNIIEIVFCYNFNQSIDILNELYNVKIIYLDDMFNQPINALPPLLNFLRIGQKFNQTINNLPESLRTLKIGFEFEKDIYNLHVLQNIDLEKVIL